MRDAVRTAKRTLITLCVVALPLHAEPFMRVTAPPELEPLAEELRQRSSAEFSTLEALIGVPISSPVLVELHARDDALARRIPRWIAGYTTGDRRTAVLFPDRATNYPHDGFEELLRHELAHVLIDRAAAGNPVPRWFHEGLATAAAGSWGPTDRALITLATIRGDNASLEAIERGFGRSEPDEVRTSYVLSFAFVRFILREFGETAPATILRLVARGYDFETAFHRTTGTSLSSAEGRFHARRSIWNRWIPILSSSVFLWLLVTLLAIFAFGLRRRRDAALLEEWEQAELMEVERQLRERRDETIH